MLHKIALVIGSLSAAAVLAIGLAAVGLGPGAADALNGPGAAAAAQPDVTAATAESKTVVDTVYVRPAAKPKVIHVTKVDRPSPTAAPRHKATTTKRSGGEGDDGGERDGGGEGRGEGEDD